MGNYFTWLSTTPTTWWHDSANPDEILRAKELGAKGVTTNPVLTYKTFQAHPEIWMPQVQKISDDLDFEERAEQLDDDHRRAEHGRAAQEVLSLGDLSPGVLQRASLPLWFAAGVYLKTPRAGPSGKRGPGTPSDTS